jgi:hypothetical protein
MEGPRRLDRRKFLKGMLQTAAVAAVSAPILEEARLSAPDFQIWQRERSERMRFDRFSGLAPAERERLITKEVEEVGAFIRGPEGERILESGTDDEIGALLTMLPPLLREHMEGTKFDTTRDQWPSVVINAGEWKNFVPNLMGHGDSRETLNKQLFGRPYGNGFYLDNKTIVTNVHVPAVAFSHLKKYLGSFPQNEINKNAQAKLDAITHRSQETGIDIMKLSLPDDHVPATTLQIEPDKHTNEDIQGRLIMAAGMKPDDTSAPDGTKVYPSIAIRVTPHLANFIYRHSIEPSLKIKPEQADTQREERHTPVADPITKSFLFLLPPGESTRHRESSFTGSRLIDRILQKGEPQYKADLHVNGMSGSPVLMDGNIVGINHRVNSLTFKNTCFDVCFFHGPDEIKEALNDSAMAMPTEWPTQ